MVAQSGAHLYVIQLRSSSVKQGIHPELFDITVHCTCGASVQTRSTKPDIKTTLCSACHPFYTGAEKFVDTAGRIEKFQKKYAKTK